MNIEKKLNKIIISSSPSGAGKTTICKKLLKIQKNLKILKKEIILLKLRKYLNIIMAHHTKI